MGEGERHLWESAIYGRAPLPFMGGLLHKWEGEGHLWAYGIMGVRVGWGGAKLKERNFL